MDRQLSLSAPRGFSATESLAMDDDWASSGGAGGGFFTAEDAPLDQADMGLAKPSSELRRHTGGC